MGGKKTGLIGAENTAQPLTIKAKEVAIMAKRKYPTLAPIEAVDRTTTTSYHSSSVRCRPLATSKYGVMEVCFSGPLEEKSFAHLRAGMIEATIQAPALVIRLSKVLMMFSGPLTIPDGTYPKNRFQWASVIARHDQMRFLGDYQRKLAGFGIPNLLFLESEEEEDEACQWAERHASYKSKRQ